MGRGPWSWGAGGGGKSEDVGGPGRVVAEEIRVAETAVPLATLGVEDPELCSSPRRPVAAAGDERLGPLADDVAALKRGRTVPLVERADHSDLA